MRHRRPHRQRKGAVLAMTMILAFLATTLVLITLRQGTQNRTLTFVARSQNDAVRAASAAIRYTAAQVCAKVSAPNVGTVEKAIDALTINPAIPPDLLGVDTDFYDGNTSRIEAVLVGSPIRVNKSQFPMQALTPEMLNDPDAGDYIDEMWSQPIRVRVSLVPKNSSTPHVTTMEASVQFRVKSLFQQAMFFNDVTPWLWGGANTYRGGIHSNKPIYIWASGNSEGARIQIERVKASKIYFRNYGSADGWPGTSAMSLSAPTDNQAVYISRGDLNGDGLITAYPSAPQSAQWYSQNQATPIQSAWRNADEYRPAYRTKWDLGAEYQNDFNNYWRKDAPAGKNNTYTRIDSENADIGNLSTLFNGNLKDDSTGFQELKVSSLATTSPHTLIEPADPSKDPSKDPVEGEKFANKAGVYVYVETFKRYKDDTVPRVLVFTRSDKMSAVEAVAAYKNAKINNDTQLSKTQKDLADNLLVVPNGIFETKRRFVDYTQQKQNAADSATPRVSAVDIDMGRLRDALGTATSPATNIKRLAVETIHGEGMGEGDTRLTTTDWTPNDTASGWNGVMYVEVDYPTVADAPDSSKKSAGAGQGWSGDAPPEGVTPAPLKDERGYATENLTAVRIHNTNKLPDRSGVPGYAKQEGFTLATNTTVYTVGNVNADGDRTTDPSYGTSSGDGSSIENGSVLGDHHFPVAIAADAVTVMSARHKDPSATGASDLTLGDNVANSKNVHDRLYAREGFTELDVGIIAGGGNPDPNYKARRPIQTFTPANWDANDIRYRGSVVTLFESRYAKKWAGGNGAQLSRSIDIGFDKTFGDGFIPPGIPRSMSCVLVNFGIIASSDFTAEIEKTPFPAPSRKAPADPI